jgi:hypothetical protein
LHHVAWVVGRKLRCNGIAQGTVDGRGLDWAQFIVRRIVGNVDYCESSSLSLSIAWVVAFFTVSTA